MKRMARKKALLCWDDIDDLDSRTLSGWQAFQPDLTETIELGGHYVKEATFVMDGEGKAFLLIYRFTGADADITVRRRIALYRSPRKPGYETMFLCPLCGRRAKRLALIGRGVGCAKCFQIRWGCMRESRTARLVRRMNETTQALGLQGWTEQPQGKPVGMRLDRYVALLARRQHLLAKLGQHFARRRRIRGDNRKHVYDFMLAVGS